MNLIFLLSCAVLVFSSAVIVYQDFKERLVDLWVILVFGANAVCSVICFRSAEALLYSSIGVAAYLGFIWLMLKAYLFLKFKKNVTIINEQLGLADVLIILCIGVTFNGIGSVLFFCFGFLFSLLAFLIFSRLKQDAAAKTIPLAGFLVFFYLATIIILNLVSLNLIDCSFIKP